MFQMDFAIRYRRVCETPRDGLLERRGDTGLAGLRTRKREASSERVTLLGPRLPFLVTTNGLILSLDRKS
jgi:hypothetical protein